jgi:hypothetical protein
VRWFGGRGRPEPSGVFSFDGTPERRVATCDECGEHHEGRTGFVLLDGDAALHHPLLDDMWRVSDWLVVNDDLLHRTVFDWSLPPASD